MITSEEDDDGPSELLMVSRRIAGQYQGILRAHAEGGADGEALERALTDMGRLATASQDAALSALLTHRPGGDLTARRAWVARIEALLGLEPIAGATPLTELGLDRDQLDVLGAAGIHSVEMLQQVGLDELMQVTGLDGEAAAAILSALPGAVPAPPPEPLSIHAQRRTIHLDDLQSEDLAEVLASQVQEPPEDLFTDALGLSADEVEDLAEAIDGTARSLVETSPFVDRTDEAADLAVLDEPPPDLEDEDEDEDDEPTSDAGPHPDDEDSEAEVVVRSVLGGQAAPARTTTAPPAPPTPPDTRASRSPGVGVWIGVALGLLVLAAAVAALM